MAAVFCYNGTIKEKLPPHALSLFGVVVVVLGCHGDVGSLTSFGCCLFFAPVWQQQKTHKQPKDCSFHTITSNCATEIPD